MSASKNKIFGGILIGLVILMAAGLGLIVLLLDEAGDYGIDITALTSRLNLSFPLRGGLENEGNDFTGQAAGWLFGIACLPIIFCLITRFINRQVSLGPRLKDLLDRFTRVNKKYFMPFHTYLSILALGLAVFHLSLSTCPNPFPEWGLIGAGILVITGLIVKLRIISWISPKLVKVVYQFHASLVVSGILISILLVGHILMD
jgi:hypothetical protein